jgi:hypothetical protein
LRIAVLGESAMETIPAEVRNGAKKIQSATANCTAHGQLKIENTSTKNQTKGITGLRSILIIEKN